MIGVEREGAISPPADKAMHLLDHRGDPDGIHAERLDAIQFLGDALKSPPCGADFILAIFLAAEGVVIARVAVLEAVSEHEVYSGVVPAECRLGLALHRFPAAVCLACRQRVSS